MGVDGTFFDSATGEHRPSTTIPIMPYYEESLGSKFEIPISTYTMNSLFYAMLK
jgi:hypothetical protein